MNRRSLIVPGAAFLGSLVLLLLVAVWVLAPQRQNTPAASGVGGPFTLTSMNGTPLSDRDLRGAPFAVFFGFTHCPDICPTKLMEMSEVLRAAGPRGAKLRALFISVDPERDTAEVLKNYLGSFDERIIGLTGSADEIARVAKAYRAYYKRVPTSSGDYTMDHTAIVYLMDREGRFIGSLNVEGKPETAAAEWLKHL